MNYLFFQRLLNSPIKAFLLGFLFSFGFFLIKAPAAHAWQVDAEWVDAAHIKVNKITIEEGDKNSLSEEAKAVGDITKLNTLINNQSGNGKIYPLASGIHGENDLVETKPTLTNHNVKAEFVLGNLCPDGAAHGGQFDVGVARTASDRALIDLGNGQLDKGETGDFIFGELPFHLEGDGVKKSCDFVTDKPAPLANNYRFNFKIGHPERHNIWFRAKDKDTLERVDDSGKSEGTFKRSTNTGENSKFWREKIEGNCPKNTSYVDVGGGDISGDVIPATYETCRKTGPFPVDVAGLNDVKQNGGGNNNGQGGVATPTCESINNNVLLSWILCGMVNAIDDSINKIKDSVDGLLDVKQEEYNNASIKAIWAYFKNLASFMLVGVALIVIIGQALNRE